MSVGSYFLRPKPKFIRSYKCIHVDSGRKGLRKYASGLVSPHNSNYSSVSLQRLQMLAGLDSGFGGSQKAHGVSNCHTL